MANILCIETSAALCSVAIYTPKQIFYLENTKTLAHAEFLAPLIETCLQNANLKPKDIQAVAISGGPGSYTGLRIGCSTAKGLCYALNIPLIAIDTLQIIAQAAINENANYDYYWPMIDARRMEVYHTIFDKTLNAIQPTTNSVIGINNEELIINNEELIMKNEASVIFSEAHVILSEAKNLSLSNENPKSKIIKSKIALCGDGAAKCAEILNLPLVNTVANAQAICSLAIAKYNAQQFEDTAYYEPFYLKQANITESKKLAL